MIDRDESMLDDEETAAMQELLSSYKRICKWGLRANSGELAAAVHVIQGFIIQHMLHRTAPDHWSNWFDAEPGWPTHAPT